MPSAGDTTTSVSAARVPEESKVPDKVQSIHVPEVRAARQTERGAEAGLKLTGSDSNKVSDDWRTGRIGHVQKVSPSSARVRAA